MHSCTNVKQNKILPELNAHQCIKMQLNMEQKKLRLMLLDLLLSTYPVSSHSSCKLSGRYRCGISKSSKIGSENKHETISVIKNKILIMHHVWACNWCYVIEPCISLKSPLSTIEYIYILVFLF